MAAQEKPAEVEDRLRAKTSRLARLRVPEGRKNQRPIAEANAVRFFRPAGACGMGGTFPTVETVGYFRASLWDGIEVGNGFRFFHPSRATCRHIFLAKCTFGLQTRRIEPLICPGGGLIRRRDGLNCPGGSLICRAGKWTRPGGSLIRPGGSLICPGSSLIRPGGGLICPGGSLICRRGHLIAALNSLWPRMFPFITKSRRQNYTSGRHFRGSKPHFPTSGPDFPTSGHESTRSNDQPRPSGHRRPVSNRHAPTTGRHRPGSGRE